MANLLSNHYVPHEIIQKLPDMEMTAIMGRPILNIFKFDDYLHEKFGDYESEGKGMCDMFELMFNEDTEKIAYCFGVEK